MRKIYSLLAMLVVTILAGFKASAATIPVTIDIDDPTAVTIVQSYWDDSKGGYTYLNYNLTAGVNSVNLYDHWGSGAVSIDLQLANGASFTSVTVNGESEDLKWVNNGALNLYVPTGANIVIRTTGGSGSGSTGGVTPAKPHATINIDDASKAVVFKNETMPGYEISLHNGSNDVEFDEGNKFLIRSWKGTEFPLTSVTLNDKEVKFTQYQPYEITPSDGDVINIIAATDEPTPTYTVTINGDLNAITSISVGYETWTTGWESGTMTFDEGTQVCLYFDNDNYDYSDVFVDGVEQTLYGGFYAQYFYMDSNKTISYVATRKSAEPEVPANSASFNLTGWDGNGFGINKGNSSWDTPVDFSSNSFTVEFDGDTQNYYLYTTGDYRIKSVTKTHGGATSKPTVYGSGPHYCIVELANGDHVDVQLEKFVDVYTATLTITADLNEFSGDITVSNSTKHVNSLVYGGTNTYKFNPNNTSDCTFTITSSTGKNLNIVKKGGVDVSGIDGVYQLGAITDGTTIDIVAVDPASVAKTPAELAFDDNNNNEAILSLNVNNIDLSASDYAAGTSYVGANVDDFFIVYFKEGYTVSSFLFGDVEYKFDGNIENIGQPLYYNGTNYQFRGYITDEYMAVSFTATKNQATYSKLVTFNVNIPAGVKITDTSDGKNEVIALNSTSDYHTFTSEYNYIDIEAAEGYDLVSVNINPNDGNDAYDRTPSDDNKVTNVMVENNYIITISVAKNSTPSVPEHGTATFTVVGNPDQITLMNGNTNATISLNEGDNAVELWANTCNFMVLPVGDGIESVTFNGAEITITSLFGNEFYALSNVTAGDNIVITTVGAGAPATPASFTVNISGDITKISSFVDEESRSNHPLALGENTIELPDNYNSYNFMLSAEKALYSVVLNGQTINPSYGTIYMISVKAGDELVIDTEFPVTEASITWSFIGCDSSIVTGIQIGESAKISADDEAFADYIDGFTANMGDVVAFWLDTTNFTLTSVKVNGEAQLTSEYQYFPVVADTEIEISATQKRIYNWTLVTNEPSHINVYTGTYGNGQPIELTDASTVLEVNEVNGVTKFSIGTTYGWLFDLKNCKIDGSLLYPDAEGHIVISPEENSVVEISLVEVERPYTGVIFVDDVDQANRIALYSGRYEAFSNDADDLTVNYHVFHFNAEDLGDGFVLYIEPIEEGLVPFIYINNVLQSGFNAETHQLKDIMLNDGDVVKVYLSDEQPEIKSLTFVHPTENEELAEHFTITIDHINVISGATPRRAAFRVEAPSTNTSNAEALTGTAVTIAADEEVNGPWVKIDEGEYIPFQPGKSYTFAVTGNHSIAYGDNYIVTGINNVMQDITGEASADIYNIQGICIKRNADSNDIKALAPGIYVIGGHKVRVK